LVIVKNGSRRWQDMVHWRAVRSTVINNRVHKNEKFLLASEELFCMEPVIRRVFSSTVRPKRLRKTVNRGVLVTATV
jgi:hypothetical protein